MKNPLVKWLRVTVVAGGLLVAIYGHAAPVEVKPESVAAPVSSVAAHQSEPHQLVQNITDELLSLLKSGKLDPVAQPEETYVHLSKVLDPVIAFDYIAKGVMGRYAKTVSSEQKTLFTERFKRGLVNTYGKGVSGFTNFQLTVLPPEGDISGQRKVSVVQEVRGSGSVNYVSYTMAQNKNNQWKLINVVLNGVNLGKTFRGQFAQEVQKNSGDVNKVIDTWGADKS